VFDGTGALYVSGGDGASFDWTDYGQSLIGLFPPGIVWLGPALTLIPTLLLTRKYVKV
jgi:hypothetical protein